MKINLSFLDLKHVDSSVSRIFLFCIYYGFFFAGSSSLAQDEPPVLGIFDVRSGSSVAVPGETIVTWLPVDLETDLPLGGDALNSLGFEVDLFLRQEGGPSFELAMTRSVATPVATFFDLPPPESGLIPAVSVRAVSLDGSILGQTGIIPLALEPNEPIELSPNDCQEAFDRWREALRRCHSFDCDPLLDGLKAAMAEMSAAERALRAAEARQEVLGDKIGDLIKKLAGLNADVDRLDGETNALEKKLATSVGDHYAMRGGQAPPHPGFGFGPAPAEEEGDWLTFQVEPGVTGRFHSPNFQDRRDLDRWRDLVQADLDSDLRRSGAYRDCVEALEAQRATLDAATQERNACQADLDTAVASKENLVPLEQAYLDAALAVKAARSAYEACLRAEQEACAEAVLRGKIYRLCDQERDIAEQWNLYLILIEAAKGAIREGGSILDDIPGAVFDDVGPTGEKTRAAREATNRAADLRSAAEDAAEEARLAMEAGDLELAEAKAREAAQLASSALDAAEEARRCVNQAKGLSDAFVYDRINEANRTRANQRQKLREWQRRRNACLDYLIENSIGDLSDEPVTRDEIAQAREAFDKLRRFMELHDQAVDTIDDLTRADLFEDSLVNEMREQLADVIASLGDVVDKFDGLADMLGDLADLAGNLAMMASDDSSPLANARKFAAWLQSIEIVYDNTVGNLPLVSEVLGYLTFLTDGYFAALEGIEQARRSRYENHVGLRTRLATFACPRIQEYLAGSLTIAQVVAAVTADLNLEDIFNADPEGFDGDAFNRVVTTMVGERLLECCQEHLEIAPPPITYSAWLDRGQVVAAAANGGFSSRQAPAQVATGPLDDANRDGVPNFVSYFLDLPLDAIVAPHLAVSHAAWDATDGALLLTVEQFSGALEVDVCIEWRPDLEAGSSWRELSGTFQYDAPDALGQQTLHFFPLTSDSETRTTSNGYYRLRLAYRPVLSLDLGFLEDVMFE